MKKLIFCPVCCYVIAAISSVFLSCEKPISDDAYLPKVTLTFAPYAQEDFSRAAVPLSTQLSRLSVAIFKGDGTKVKSINQTVGDTDYGTISVSLPEGSYKIVAIAHNSTEGNATITSTEKVTFANNKMTDTFCYCGELAVGTASINKELQMQRVVAMVRLTISGAIPANVARFKFYYTGGSSTLNPETGYGCVNSKQTEYRSAFPVGDGSAAATTFDLYTAPHELNDVLKLVITAQDADNQTVNEWTMENIPVTKNKITTWNGSLFSDSGTGGPVSDGGFSLTLDTTWGGTQSYAW